MSNPIRYASCCSGVEAASLAWKPLGWKPVWFSEVEPFPCKVLAERFGASSPVNPLDPEDAFDEIDRKERTNWLKAIRREKMPSVTEAKIPNLGDMSKINGKEYHGTIDLLVGGTPCQGFSIAGTQKGLDDPRSALALKYVELLGSARPRWFVWENVPNAFSCNGGEDIKEFFRQITEIGYGVCWRVLDAEYVRVDGFPGAVPQRRRRVFAVGYLGDWRPAAKVLFESKVLCGDSAPRRIKGQESSGDTETCNRQSDALDDGTGAAAEIRNVVETGKGFYRESDVGNTLAAHEDQHRRNIICIGNGQSAAASAPAVDKSTTLSCDHEAPIIVFHGSQDPISNRDHANAVNRNQGLENCVCIQQNQVGEVRIGNVSGSMTTNSNASGRNFPIVAISQHGDVAGSLTARHDSSPCADRGMNIIACNTKKQAMNCDENVIGCLSATDYKEPQMICYENHGNDSRITESPDVSPTITRQAGTGGNNLPLVAFGIDPLASNSMESKNPNSGFHEIEVTKTLDTLEDRTILLKNIGWIARRITPLEAERLMGFPDYHTRIPWNGKHAEDCPDARRYKACGNSMCVNVMRWLGTRIDAVEKSIQNGTFEQLFNAEDLA